MLLTHSDFYLPDEVVADFEEQSGYTLDVAPDRRRRHPGQPGRRAGRQAVGRRRVRRRQHLRLARPRRRRVRAVRRRAAGRRRRPTPCPATTTARLVPVDNGNVCVNVDDTWFADRDLDPPTTLDDLTDPAYRDLFVVPSAAEQLARAGVPAHHDRGVRRRLADYWAGPPRQRRRGRARLVGGLRGRVHPGRRRRRQADRRVLRLLAGLHRRRRGRHDHQRAARHLLPAGRVRRRARRRRQPRRRPGAGRLHARPRRCRRRCPSRCTSSRSSTAPSCPRTGRAFADAPDRPVRGRPGRDRGQPRGLAASSGPTSSADDERDGSLRRTASPASRWRRCRWRCSAVFFVLPVAGMLGRGLWPDGALRPRRGARRARPARAPAACVWFTALDLDASATVVAVRAGAAGGLRAAPAATSRCAARCGRRCWCRSCCRPSWSGVAFRQLLREGGPLGFLGLDGTPVAIVAGLVFFNVAVVIRTVGAAWEGLDRRPGRGRGRARREPRAGLPHRDPAGAAARRSCPRPAWSSSSAPPPSGSCSPSAGCATPRSRPRSTCSPPCSTTCRARPRCRSCSCVAVVALLVVAARRAPGAPTRRCSAACPAPGAPASCRPAAARAPPALLLVLLAAPDRRAGRAVAARRRVAGAWRTTATCRPRAATGRWSCR